MVLEGGGEGEGSVADGPIALEIGGVWVERFGVKRPGILRRTWRKSQGRVWAENVTRGGVEVGGSEALFFPCFLLLPHCHSLGGFSMLLGAEGNLLLKFRKMGRTSWDC